MKKTIKKIIYILLPILKNYHRFMSSQTNDISIYQYVSFLLWKKSPYWPINKNNEITHPQNIYVGINSNAGTRPGCYLQGNGGIYIGNYVHFASNIGIISANHNLYNQKEHILNEVIIDDYCWIGMNVVILPGCHLGPRTVVGAGSVVTKSFPEGYCVIAGNPAKVIKELDKENFIPTRYSEEFYGYVPKEEFKQFAQKYLQDNKYYNKIMESAYNNV